MIALVGSGEFLPGMMDTDRILLTDRPGRVVHLPTAAGLDSPDTIERGSRDGGTALRRPGEDVVSLPAIDDHSLMILGWQQKIHSEMVLDHLSGGNLLDCAKTSRDSAVWDAILAAWERALRRPGASRRRCTTTVAPNQMGGKTEAGLGVVPNLAVIPHYDRARFLMPIFGRVIRNSTPPDAEVIGIEEDTALAGRPGGDWTVTGRQSVVLLERHSNG